ncbi:MAG: adenine phosphoribosyltransferase [Pelagibacterales bacterium]|mgnify:CR=1 FL=1|nr:adenine phosphoribosyltransferase [Pelagibacterales bacterium]OUU62709.1 MAG: adenine phosphoribosyltransferase [Alphaproteobacteria bacterium TMED62]|tara:strand:+ start:10194 stop:10712 length:519 start_codon:yes stop_codon:yes gene_type:complete
MDLNNYIRDIADFPKKGIIFKDITPLLNNKNSFDYVLGMFKERLVDKKIDQIVGIESRGFILGAPLASTLNCGFVPIRKKGKLPYNVISETYDLEYGKDTLEIHADALAKNNNVVLVDDVLATGGTINASLKLLEAFKVNIVECQFLIEIKKLNGAKKILSKKEKYYSILKY